MDIIKSLRIRVPFLLLVLSGCTTSESAMIDTANGIGWMHGNCLAIKNAALTSGTMIDVMTLDEPQKSLSATIIAKTQNANECYALQEDRREINLAAGNTFYSVATDEPVSIAIGLVDQSSVAKNQHLTRWDINKDHIADTFSYCSTSEGVQFNIWQGQPYKSKSLWKGYYYLGYDSEVTCPQ